MDLGVVGKPNVGKSTFFSAATLATVEVASYPFTTIDPNRGVGYVRAECPHKEMGVECTPNNSLCESGVRLIPVELIDVAGLVPGAHEGKGLGNKFLDNLRQASALIHVVDASGSTDAEGNPIGLGEHDPLHDVAFLEEEVVFWIQGILSRGWDRTARTAESTGQKIETAIYQNLTGLGISEKQVIRALHGLSLPDKPRSWTEEHLHQVAAEVRIEAKPLIIAANKMDIAGEVSPELKSCGIVVPVCAEYEFALRRASKAGLVEYIPGASSFSVIAGDRLTGVQRSALEKIQDFLEAHGSTGVQKCLETAVYDLLRLIPVYPVEDETHLTDKEGRVLPDVHLLPEGSTAIDLAEKVHTDLAKGFIRAVDARTKRVIGHDHVLKAGDIVRIVAKT